MGLTMPKITIYVADELKTEMDRFEPLNPNWSAIAQEAFNLECQLLKTRKKGAGKMDKVIERLRASRDAEANQDKVSGDAAGRRWAMEKAGYRELKRLADWEQPSKLSYPLADEAYSIIMGFGLAFPPGVYPPTVADDCDDFWTDWNNAGRPPDAFVKAFVDAAVEVFAEVKDKL
jgi:hypothetical protein